MKIKYVAVLALLFLAGCTDESSSSFDVHNIRYVYDTRTDLCFAYTNTLNGPYRGVTHVPCVEEVLDLVEAVDEAPYTLIKF